MLGVFLVFFGGPMIDLTVKVLLFAGLLCGSFLGFQSVNDQANVYPDFAAKKDNA